MLRRLILAAALAAGFASPALAQAVPQVIQTCGVGVTLPLGPGGRLYQDQTGILCTTGGGGGGGGGGSVTAAGTNGTVAQAVQGINGGVPQNSFPAQYNSTLPTFASGASGYLAIDSNGRLVPSPTLATAANQAAMQGSATGGAAATVSQLGGGIYNATAPTLTSGQQAALQFDVNGNLKTTGGGGSAGTGSVTAPGVNGTQAQAVQGITGGIPQAVMQQDAVAPAGSPFSATSAATLYSIDTTGYQSITNQLGGTFSATIVYEISNDNTNWVGIGGTLTTLNGSSPPATSDSSAQMRTFPVVARYFRVRVSSFASGTVTAAPYLRSAPGQTSAVAVGSIGAGSNTIGGVGVSAVSTSAGVASFSRLPSSAATTNLTQAKAAAGRVYKVIACNTTTTAARIKFYNALSANVTVGTTAPLFTRPIPAAAAAGGLACASYDWSDIGTYFTTGISWAITAGSADNDTTAVAAGAITDVSVELQ